MRNHRYFDLLKNREYMYLFLKRLYIKEVDERLLNMLKGLRFPKQADDVELRYAYKLMEYSLNHVKPETLTDLAVDYARVFLGAGIASLEAAYPYESLYTGEKLIMQEARDEAVARYDADGLQVSNQIDFPEDHISLQLEYLAFLCRKTAYIAGDEEQVNICFKDQAAFLKRLLNWVPDFCDDAERYAATAFYKALAVITRAYIRMDYALIKDLTA